MVRSKTPVESLRFFYRQKYTKQTPNHLLALQSGARIPIRP